MRLGLVIPALDEAPTIAAAVASAREALAPVAIVVADGDSADETAAAAERAGAIVVVEAGPRGTALNAAIARLAGVDAIVIIHADSRLPSGAGDEIRDALADKGVVGGAFRLRFDRPGRLLGVAAAGANLRARQLGVSYADQGIFVRRSTLVAVGGFRPWPLWEDADLLRRLRGEGRVVLLRGRTTTSARRHEADGVLRTGARVWWLTLRFRLGASPEELARSWRTVREP